MYKLIILLTLLQFQTVLGQAPLEEGFKLLDAQQFAEAETFFSNYLLTNAESKTAKICKGRAMGLGGNPEEALQFFTDLQAVHKEDIEVDLNLAEAFMWNEKFAEAKSAYGHLLTKDSTLFVANYGYANAHAALGENEIALDYIGKAIELDSTNQQARIAQGHIALSRAYNAYKAGNFTAAADMLTTILMRTPQDKSASELLSLVRGTLSTNIATTYSQSWDVGQNKSKVYQLDASMNLFDKHTLSYVVGQRNISNNLDYKAEQQYFHVADKIILSKKLRGIVGIGLNINKSDESSGSQVFKKLGLEGFWGPRLYTMIEYNTEVLDYNVSLVEKSILVNNFSAAVNVNFLKHFGVYSKLIYATQIDQNTKVNGFHSLYYTAVAKPLFRIGLNYTNISYLETSTDYFSPENYWAVECFVLLENRELPSPLKYSISAAIGSQHIGDFAPLSSSRIEGSIGYAFNNGMNISTGYKFNDTAAATDIGAYSYNEAFVKLAYAISPRK